MFANGNQRTYRGESGDGKARYDNPFWTVNENPFTDNVDRLIGNFQLNYVITDWMDIVYRGGSDVYTDTRQQIFSNGSSTAIPGQIFNHDLTNSILNSDLLINFNYKINHDLKSKLTIGQNAYQEVSTFMYVQGDGLTIPNFYSISNTSGQIEREAKAKMRRAAIFGDLSFNYSDYLYLNGTLRNEWSTTLPENNN